eukprot:TRINITY_DN16733_c0_g1_i1.p1 TRINITY_DN16733_c0_g1~~TRINITY_DN16733_c0_g1_i1.p1  ORF type:complete len:277 (-),score=21.62 TRINITY_DN16733_c0_g1_i1:168-998(-)
MGKCNGVIDKTYWVTTGQYHNKFLDEHLISKGWTRAAKPDISARYIYPSFKDRLYKLENAKPQNSDPRCLVQICMTGNSDISRKLTLKSNLPVTLREYHTRTGENIDFLPRTWRLYIREEHQDFMKQLPCDLKGAQMYIFKKAKSARGANIFLENNPVKIKEKFHSTRSFKKDSCTNSQLIVPKGDDLNQMPWRDEIVQDYVSNTLLVHNKKFHIRAYWLVASMDPLFVLYHSSYLMLASSDYDKNSTSLEKHVSNNSITKKAHLKLMDTHMDMEQ